MKTEQRTALYRHFAADGTLLYIGISLSALNRLGQHRDHAHWFTQIARVEIEHFPSRAEALEAERRAIQFEDPKHNVMLRSEAKVVHFRAAPEPEAGTPRDQSRHLLVREVAFKPLYSPEEVGHVLGSSAGKVRALIADGRMGHVVLAEGVRNTKFGMRPYKHYGVTGWQLIEFIEAMERGAVSLTEAVA